MENAAEMGGGPMSSRWNPTKEQINILENLYKQGVRTPSAEQIQQITSRLKAYGHIEGKNVFYWFQNHKARQRQKQKQDSTFSYFNHFLHFPHHFPSPNVVCNPYYVHQNDVGYYPQFHNNSKVIQSSGVVRRRSKSERRNSNNNYYCNDNNNVGFGSESIENEVSAVNLNIQTETLSLFPTHPTGDLQAGPPSTPPPPPPQPTASASASSGNSAEDSGGGCSTYFDFLSVGKTC